MEQQQKILKLKDKEIAAFKKKKNNSVGTSQKLQVANLLRICMGPEKKFSFFIPSHLCKIFGRRVFHHSFVFFFAVAKIGSIV